MKFDMNLLKYYAENSALCLEKHPVTNIFIAGYHHNSNYRTSKWDDINIHCRGLILDGKGVVLERPFKKFWTYKQYLSKDTVLLSENQIANIPKEDFSIFEKVDGTMVTLYWVKGSPFLATQRSFTNPKALRATSILYRKYSHTFNNFDKNFTYIFEAIYPETNILIDYGDREDLVLIGIIDKKTGDSLPIVDIGFPTCKDFTKLYGHIKNLDDLASLNLANQEGFVLLWENGLRIKLKFPWYLEAHKKLDSLVYMSMKTELLKIELKKIFNSKEHSIDTFSVLNCLQEQDFCLSGLRSKISIIHYFLGYEYWEDSIKNEFIKQFHELKETNKNLSDKDIWLMIEPKYNELFDVKERLSNEHIYDTKMWNWKKILL